MKSTPPINLRSIQHREQNRVSLAAIAETFDPGRLTQAREAEGMAKTVLAELVGVTPAAIGQYESALAKPRAEVIRELSDALSVPPEFFVAGRPFGRLDGSQAHFRSLRSTTARDRAKAIAFIEQVWELTTFLERKVRFPDLDLPKLGADELTPASAAHALRRHWNLGRKPVSHLVAVAETHGIIATLLSLSNNDVARVGAFSTSHLSRPVIVLTPERARDVYEYRFTVAHELGHILLHRNTAPGDRIQEREADQFAAEFLTPIEAVGNLLPRTVDFALLINLSRHWGVSVNSLIFRMKELGIVSEASIRRGYQKLQAFRSQGLIPSEPVTAFPGEVPSLMAETAKVLEASGIGIADIADKLKWRPSRVREVMGMEDNRPSLEIVR